MKPDFFARSKTRFPDTLLLFEMESNYACFHTDARIAADVLSLGLATVLTHGEPVPTTVIRRESRDRAIQQLVLAGHRVAICPAARAAAAPRPVRRHPSNN